MAKIWKLPIEVPKGITIQMKDSELSVVGPLGVVKRKIPLVLKFNIEERKVTIERKKDDKSSIAIQGTMRAHLINMIKGVTEGWSKNLEMVGAGFRAEVRGNDLVLSVGFSHPVVIKKPEKINFTVNKSLITIQGIDKEEVGSLAAKIRMIRKPEPYKGKGIKYQDEIVRRKLGKQAAKTEGGV